MSNNNSLLSSLIEANVISRAAESIFDKKKAAYVEAYKLAYSSKSLEAVRLSAEAMKEYKYALSNFDEATAAATALGKKIMDADSDLVYC